MIKENKIYFLNVVLGVTIVLWPFYYFSGSKPQFFHYLLFFSFIYVLFTEFDLLKKLIFSDLLIKLFLILTFYSFIINGYWSIYYKNLSPLFGSIKILFICISFINFQFLIKKKILNYRMIIFFILLCLFIQLILFLLINQNHYNFKPTNFFFYKSQFSVFLLSLNILFIYFYFKNNINLLNCTIIILIISVLIILSGSVFASLLFFISLISFFSFEIFRFVKFKNFKVINKFNILLFSMVLVLIILIFYFEKTFLYKINNLIFFYEYQNDLSLASRGYSRLINYWQYLFFGAGYGLNFRFLSEIDFHSTYLNIIFQYGFFAVIFYYFYFLKILKINNFSLIFNLFIYLGYGLAHDIFYQPFFWFVYLLLTEKFNSQNHA